MQDELFILMIIVSLSENSLHIGSMGELSQSETSHIL